MNGVAVGAGQVDEDELNEELEAMQQEQLDEQMIRTGTVPVSDAVHKLPAAANGPSKSLRYPVLYCYDEILQKVSNHFYLVKGKAQAVQEDDEEEELRKLQAEMAM
jgi:charged multivesicular body protein 4